MIWLFGVIYSGLWVIWLRLFFWFIYLFSHKCVDICQKSLMEIKCWFAKFHTIISSCWDFFVFRCWILFSSWKTPSHISLHAFHKSWDWSFCCIFRISLTLALDLHFTPIILQSMLCCALQDEVIGLFRWRKIYLLQKIMSLVCWFKWCSA